VNSGNDVPDRTSDGIYRIELGQTAVSHIWVLRTLVLRWTSVTDQS